MRISVLLVLLQLAYITGCAQADNRIQIISINPSENTGQDYSSWLKDNVNELVPNHWASANFKYIDVTLQLEGKSKITKLSFYDFEGIFNDNPAYVYALNNGEKTLIGTFTGERYMQYVDLVLQQPVTADAIIIHKYCNNIPQKIMIYGSVISTDTPAETTPHAVLTFDEISPKKAGDPAFELAAGSNNNQVAVTFTSSDKSIVSVEYTNGIWKAHPLKAGSAAITASQAGSNNYLPATDVTRSVVVLEQTATTINNNKIPIDPSRWFQLTNASNSAAGLFDGNTNVNVNTGWGKILDNYDHYYPVIDNELIDLESVKMFDGEGSNSAQPMKLYVITAEDQKIAIATFTGGLYNTWVGPDPANPGKFTLPTSFKGIKYIVINSWNFFPTEIEFYGNYTPGSPVTAAVRKSFPLKYMFGVNGFEWNFEDPKRPGDIDNQLFKAAKVFSGFRHYMDWEKLELSKGSYTFNPTLSGGWNYDAIYDSCKAAGIEVLACLKTLPPWMLSTYPAGQRDLENVPVQYGKDFSDPNSYIEQAKVAFQYAARYGSNKNVNRSLLHVNSTPRWSGDQVNTVKVGLGTVKYIECENERDKWWKGRKAYQTAFEYAANLSAFYDGNKNTMGAGVGIKNADPNMLVVMAGTALPSTDYLKGMVDWCRRNRGYKADGSVDLCWDVINYHYYSNDSRSSQNGQATRGAAPELSGAAEVAAEFIEAAHQFCNDIPVWITEAGYDANQGSAFKAIAIGNKSASHTQADWILRSSLLYARTGIERLFFYGLYDDNLNNPLQFSSSGLINSDKTRKPAADFIYQATRLLGDYTYMETINTDPFVDRYESKENSIYAIVVPDEKGRTAQFTLDLGTATQANIYTPKIGSDNMDVQRVSTRNGSLTITATETPVFVVPVGAGAAHIAELNLLANNNYQGLDEAVSNSKELERLKFDESIHLYPNPVPDFLNITLKNTSNKRVSLRVYEAGSGRIHKVVQYRKPNIFFTEAVSLKTLPRGFYMIEVSQGSEKATKKIFKNSK